MFFCNNCFFSGNYWSNNNRRQVIVMKIISVYSFTYGIYYKFNIKLPIEEENWEKYQLFRWYLCVLSCFIIFWFYRHKNKVHVSSKWTVSSIKRHASERLLSHHTAYPDDYQSSTYFCSVVQFLLPKRDSNAESNGSMFIVGSSRCNMMTTERNNNNACIYR